MPSAAWLARSYSRSVIWRTVLGIVLVGLGLGWGAGRLFPPEAGIHDPGWILPLVADGFDVGLDEDSTPIADRLQRIADHPEALLRLAVLLQALGDPEHRRRALAAWPHGGGEGDRAERGAIDQVGPLLLAAQGAEPGTELLALAAERPPARWANRALADFFAAHDLPEQALEHYIVEGDHFAEASRARQQAWRLAARLGHGELIEQWQADPRWAPEPEPRVLLDRAVERGDFLTVLRWLLPSLYADPDWLMIAIALVAASVWLFFLYHTSYGSPARRRLALQCLCAFALGVVSTWLTVFLIHVERYVGFGMGEDSFSQAIYCFAGIGLREEVAKLICFLPLLPWLLRHGDPLAWLLVPSCVGAGFAAEENVAYFSDSLGGALSGRFLTANFLHVALTGLVGQALCQGLAWPRTHLGDFGAALLVAIAVHGAYDAFLIVDILADYSIASMIIFILMGQYYFQALHQVRTGSRPRLSLTMTFCAGLALTLAVALVLLSLRLGFSAAVDVLLVGSIASLIILIMFIRGINDGLRP